MARSVATSDWKWVVALWRMLSKIPRTRIERVTYPHPIATRIWALRRLRDVTIGLVLLSAPRGVRGAGIPLFTLLA